MANPPPAPVQKKSGLGCLGCGCLILALLALLFLGLVGGVVYGVYNEAIVLTSPTPPAIPSFDGGDDVYNRAKQKITDFNHDLQDHQAATVHLTADEINTLIARNPDFTKNGVHLFVTLNSDQAQVQWTFPTSLLPYGILPNRYFNGSTTFRVTFDSTERMIKFDPQSLQVGNDVLLGESSDDSDTSSSFQKGFVRGFNQSFAPAFNKSFNQGLQKTPGGRELLEQAKTVEIKDGELVIETE